MYFLNSLILKISELYNETFYEKIPISWMCPGKIKTYLP